MVTWRVPDNGVGSEEDKRKMMKESTIKTACIWAFLPFVAWGCAISLSRPWRPRGQRHPQCAMEKGGPPPHAPAHGYRRKYSYLYYPSSNVYYSAERKAYFYLDGNGWKVRATLPASVQIKVEEGVVVELDTDLPYACSQDCACSHYPRNGKWKKR